MDPSYPLLAAMAMSLALLQINQRLASPVIAIVNRWMRWFIFAFGTAYIIDAFGLIDRPYWALAAICFLLWFLLETLYNWVAISALSHSPLPLFPRYLPNPGGDEWPMQARLLKARDWMRAHGYRHLQALRAEVGGGIHLRVSVYENEKDKVRAQLMFMPESNGAVSLACVLTSIVQNGGRVVTDNLHIPFGGFYPERWSVERMPWCRSLPKLVERHMNRLARIETPIKANLIDPLSDISTAQNELDRLNTDLGFLFPHGDREEHGKITHEGRYRVWKEIWMLDYLGRSARYL
ncbi:MAG: hypothetical protein WC378_07395 [Opitutaceae bacterium]|jgi:hypothetical protein